MYASNAAAVTVDATRDSKKLIPARLLPPVHHGGILRRLECDKIMQYQAETGQQYMLRNSHDPLFSGIDAKLEINKLQYCINFGAEPRNRSCSYRRSKCNESWVPTYNYHLLHTGTWELDLVAAHSAKTYPPEYDVPRVQERGGRMYEQRGRKQCEGQKCDRHRRYVAFASKHGVLQLFIL